MFIAESELRQGLYHLVKRTKTEILLASHDDDPFYFLNKTFPDYKPVLSIFDSSTKEIFIKELNFDSDHGKLNSINIIIKALPNNLGINPKYLYLLNETYDLSWQNKNDLPIQPLFFKANEKMAVIMPVKIDIKEET